MASLHVSAALLLLWLLLGASVLSVHGTRSSGPNIGRGVSFDMYRPEYRTNPAPVDLHAEGTPAQVTPIVSEPAGRKMLHFGGRKMLQSVLNCNKLVGICGTQAANSGFTSGQFLQSGGGFGAGNGIGNASGDRRGRNIGRNTGGPNGSG